jgi:hypothetical protein
MGAAGVAEVGLFHLHELLLGLLLARLLEVGIGYQILGRGLPSQSLS